ncbi:hypothetical protein GYMLUDRAFT_1026208 [Collybiopsis luxurians FD-317 M1]|uniref:DUF6534 domain-containing protein n=1 Tax=Collybiopsis luxurians FD-317 M1 TaxID=944289 RepID=A0A0D0AST8_9AGAR|nr:hypothetical protein GYMLUDRAFT_1026208 [Collybiopsis luxurians FD-317 M1]
MASLQPAPTSPLPGITSIYKANSVIGPRASGILFHIWNTLYSTITDIYQIAFRGSDRLWLRVLGDYIGCLSFTMLISEVVFQVLETFIAWWGFGSGWGLPERIEFFPPEANPIPALIGFDVSFTYAFYCWRIFMLGKSYIIPVIVCLISTAQLALSIYISAMILKVVELQLVHEFNAAISTITRVENAIKYIIETGAITAIVMLVELALFLALPNETYNYMVVFSSGKIYANALLANLNSRITFVTSGTAHLYQSDSDIRSTVNSLWPTSHPDTKQRHQNPTAAPSDNPTQNIVLHSTTVLGLPDQDGAYELVKLEGRKTFGHFAGPNNEV